MPDYKNMLQKAHDINLKASHVKAKLELKADASDAVSAHARDDNYCLYIRHCLR